MYAIKCISFGATGSTSTSLKSRFVLDRMRKVTTLVRLIMTDYIVAGINNDGYKYGGIAEKPPNLTRNN